MAEAGDQGAGVDRGGGEFILADVERKPLEPPLAPGEVRGHAAFAERGAHVVDGVVPSAFAFGEVDRLVVEAMLLAEGEQGDDIVVEAGVFRPVSVGVDGDGVDDLGAAGREEAVQPLASVGGRGGEVRRQDDGVGVHAFDFLIKDAGGLEVIFEDPVASAVAGLVDGFPDLLVGIAGGTLADGELVGLPLLVGGAGRALDQAVAHRGRVFGAAGDREDVLPVFTVEHVDQLGGLRGIEAERAPLAVVAHGLSQAFDRVG